MATLAAFYETRNLYRTYTGYTEPLSFEEWAKRPQGEKAALLFVQFFDQITLAWEKANAFDFIEGEEGVSIVLQYLEKQVAQDQYYKKDDPKKKASAEFRKKNPDKFFTTTRRIIEEDPRKFTPAYIYRVAYNCMYCICHDLKSVQDRWDNETSAITIYDGKELSVFDQIADYSGSAEQVAEDLTFETEFWRVVEDAGLTAEKVMRYLLSGDANDLKKANPRSKQYENDPLRDIEVSPEMLEEVIEDLRTRFSNLSCNSFCGRYIAQFQSA